MLRRLPLVLVFAATAFACSDDDGTPQPADTAGDAAVDAGDTFQDAGTDAGLDAVDDVGEDSSIGPDTADVDDVGEDTEDDSGEETDAGNGTSRNLCFGDEDAFRAAHTFDNGVLPVAWACVTQTCADSTDPACGQTCVADEARLSPECGGCYADAAACAFDNCASDCELGSGICVRCIEQTCGSPLNRCTGELSEVAGDEAAQAQMINTSPDFTASIWAPEFRGALLDTLMFGALERIAFPLVEPAQVLYRAADAAASDPVQAELVGERAIREAELASIGLFGSGEAGTLGAQIIYEVRSAPPEGARYRFVNGADSETTAAIDVWNQVPGEAGRMYDAFAYGDRTPDAARAPGNFIIGVDLDGDFEMETTYTIALANGSQHTFWFAIQDDVLVIVDTTSTGDIQVVEPDVD